MSIATAVGGVAQIGVYGANWKFLIGQAVCFGELSALVLSRQCSVMGRQLYYLWIAEGGEERPYRWVAGDALELGGSAEPI